MFFLRCSAPLPAEMPGPRLPKMAPYTQPTPGLAPSRAAPTGVGHPRKSIPLIRRISQYAAPLAFFAVVGTVVVAVALIRPPSIILFEGVEGPSGLTPLAVSPPADWRSFAAGGTSRLAVLLTDTTSSWLGVAHGLKTIGVPFRITLDYEDALRHDVVLVYPRISGRLLSPDALRALAEFPERGGTLIGVNVEGGGLASVFGFAEAVPSRERRELV